MSKLRFSCLALATWLIVNVSKCVGQSTDTSGTGALQFFAIHAAGGKPDEFERTNVFTSDQIEDQVPPADRRLFRPAGAAAGSSSTQAFSTTTVLVATTTTEHSTTTPNCDTPTPPECVKSDKYRTIDGSCNNFDNPSWGRIFSEQRRLLPPVYNDGLNEPRTKDKDGNDLPSARLISNIVHVVEEETKFHPTQSEIVMLFGQFLDHDITLTPVERSNVDCCKSPHNEVCFNIDIPPDDEQFPDSTCMMFRRSSPSLPTDCPNPRQQLNIITSYIDGSVVYGSTTTEMNELRASFGGLMKIKGEDLLPENPIAFCTLEPDTDDYCVNAGDVRVMEVPQLTSLHTVFMREHNRIARKLSNINPQWDDETIFQEARKIVAAEIQHVTYKEYLAAVLGRGRTRRLGLRPKFRGHRDTYDPSVDATMANGFSTAAFRFGHSQIPRRVKKRDRFYEVTDAEFTEDTFFKPRMYFNNIQNVSGTDSLIRSSLAEDGYRVDRILENAVRDHLFGAFDLAAFNIQRGRDHGLPPYNAWREFCGLPKATRWGRGAGGFTNHSLSVINLLRQAYRNPEDVDLFTAGVSEKHISGAVVGPTFACLLEKQFEAMKNGDRFFYERRGQPDPNGVGNTVKTGFTRNQVNQIKRMKMSKIICENMGSDTIPPNAFKKLDGDKNKDIPCSEMPDINFEFWKE